MNSTMNYEEATIEAQVDLLRMILKVSAIVRDTSPENQQKWIEHLREMKEDLQELA